MQTRLKDQAVSPVIAVILMVAITVVLAATVYIWVSGFNSTGSTAPHTLALRSDGPLGTEPGGDSYWKNYTITSASPDLQYGTIHVNLNGEPATFTPCPANPTTALLWSACRGADALTATDYAVAGDTITLACRQTDTDCLSGNELVLIDADANAVMLTLGLR